MNKAILLLVLASLTPGLRAQEKDKSPHIIGMAHMAYYVTDLGKTTRVINRARAAAEQSKTELACL